MKRIGEILVANSWVDQAVLARVLTRQQKSGHRLCSLLVINGVLDADEASCALAEQHGVAAALQRHMTHRDRSLAELLSAPLARACIALPIGRMGSGEVIVCVRDPSPALEAQLARAMKERIRLAVAPAHQLEALVLETYGPDDANEFDVDLSTGPIPSLELEEDQIEAMSDDAMADLGSLELVDLDDTGVEKDASQSQAPIGNQRPTTLPPTNVMVDAPSYRSSSGIVVDAPSQRSSSGIVVDAPSQREPPGRAALSAAGITIPRTQTPQHGASGDVIAVPRTRTPIGLDAAGPAVPRTRTPNALDAAGVAVPRTRTPNGLDSAGVAVPRTRTPNGLDAAGIAVPRTKTPALSALDRVASASAIVAAANADARAAAEARAAGEPQDAPPPAAPPPQIQLELDDEDPVPEPRLDAPVPNIEGLPVRPTEPTPAPSAARAPGTPAIPLPSILPPRPDASRPPPAALAALQRASAVAARAATPPSIPRIPAPAAPVRSIATPPDGIAVGTQLPSAALAVSAHLSSALTSLQAANTTDDACDAMMVFATKRWSAVLLLDIEDGTATGRRGHGAQVSDDLAQWVVMSLAEPSLLHAAITSRGVATVTPSGHGDVEDRLQKLLGLARAPSAIAIHVDGEPGFLLAVGDPNGDDPKTAAADLERLAGGAGSALTRLRGR